MTRIFPLPPLQHRVAVGRPVLARDQVTAITQRLLELTTAETVHIMLTHTARVLTRVANGQALSGDDGDTFEVWLLLNYEGQNVGTSVRTNQLDDTMLQAVVRQCESLARQRLKAKEDDSLNAPQTPDTLVPTHLWHDETVRAMSTARATVVPDMVSAVEREGLMAAGFLGFMARSEALVTKDGIAVYNEETDSEVTMTARSQDGRTSGWGGQSGRNWATVDPQAVVRQAVQTAKWSANPSALEPGRRTAILSSTAVAQIMCLQASEFDAYLSDGGGAPFSKAPHGSKWGQQIVDSRISMRSDPDDPDGGYRPYFHWGHGTPAMTWLENGVLKNLSYSIEYAMGRGKSYSELPHSIRVSGGSMSVEQMIAQCDEGIYVNRLSDLHLVDARSGLVSGVTRDGCYLVRHGQIDRAVKDFRILTSPFFFMNNIIALGPTGRASLGYTPPNRMTYDPYSDWPRRPIIAPPMMVRDFNFSALGDAV